jgi:hypothetical protein
MDANSRKKPSQLEINDLIAEAVVNAEARRNQAEDLLSDEQAAAVKGGVREALPKPPAILGVLWMPPITLGKVSPIP